MNKNPPPEPNCGLPPSEPIQRADAEIAVLEALVAQGTPIVAQLGACEPEFRSRLRYVDPERRHIIVDTGTDAAAGKALLALPRVTFVAEWDEWRIAFTAADPQQTCYAGAAAIRLAFPDAISSHSRREYSRAPVPPERPLRCVASADGVDWFEASICDISLGGLGILQYDADIALEAGTLIRDCRIESPGREPIAVDLEVRYTGPADPVGNRPAHRAGCKFLDTSPALTDLVLEFFSQKD